MIKKLKKNIYKTSTILSNRSLFVNMDSLPNEVYHKIMKIYFTQSVMKEYMNNVEYIKPQMYSNRRKIMIAERGAFTGKVFACKNCGHVFLDYSFLKQVDLENYYKINNPFEKVEELEVL